MDPLTAMSVEIENLKKQVLESNGKLDAANTSMLAMMNTNKNLVAEITALKSVPMNVKAETPSIDDLALAALRKNLNLGE